MLLRKNRKRLLPPLKRTSKNTDRTGIRGFSFLEILIGCVLFTFGTLGIYTVYTSGEKARFYASQRVRALYAAKGVLAHIEALPYADIRQRPAAAIEGLDGFSSEAAITPERILPQGIETAKTVTITVRYPLSGEQDSVTLTSRFYKPD